MLLPFDLYKTFRKTRAGTIILQAPVLLGRTLTFCGTEYTWWGAAQWYKWRWNGTHIDLGPLSIYGLPQNGAGKLFWRGVAVIIKPQRMFYHKYFASKF